MTQLKRYTRIGIIFVLVLGTLSHFFYEWSGNNFIIGLFTPINESTWEHMKLLFFPMLVYSPVMIFKLRKTCPYIASSFYLGILLGTSLIPIFFYAYTGILGKNIFILDLGVFVLSVILAFLTVYKLASSHKQLPCAFLIYGFVCLYFICFIFFTCKSPDTEIFRNPVVSYHHPNPKRLNIPFFSNRNA